MRVKIGNYPNRLTCNIHRDLMDRRYEFIWPAKQTHFEQFVEKLEDFIQVCYTPINYFLDKRTQKIDVRIDPWDTWSMDHTLAHIIVPMLKQLKETKHGAPHVDDCDVPSHLTSGLADRLEPRENEWDTDAYWFDRWEWVLNEMIWAFEQKNIDWEEQYYKFEPDPDETFGMKLVWKDEDALRRHETRMRNGFKLFGKYYQNLWD